MSQLQDKVVLRPKDIQAILGMSQRRLYEFLNDAPFRVVRVGRELRIPNAPFKEWLMGNI
jgi:predicted DNA-binding transcriptional regulator AlpA